MRGVSDETPLLISPRRTEVLTGKPEFAWRPVTGAARYKVTISGESGEVWTRTVTTSTLAYPSDAPALAPDTDYLWEVQALADRGTSAGDTAFHWPPRGIAGRDQLAQEILKRAWLGTRRPLPAGSSCFYRGLAARRR